MHLCVKHFAYNMHNIFKTKKEEFCFKFCSFLSFSVLFCFLNGSTDVDNADN